MAGDGRVMENPFLERVADGYNGLAQSVDIGGENQAEIMKWAKREEVQSSGRANGLGVLIMRCRCSLLGIWDFGMQREGACDKGRLEMRSSTQQVRLPFVPSPLCNRNSAACLPPASDVIVSRAPGLLQLLWVGRCLADFSHCGLTVYAPRRSPALDDDLFGRILSFFSRNEAIDESRFTSTN